MKKVIARIILITEPGVSWTEKIQFYFTSLLKFGPIALLLNYVDLWFVGNRQFGTFLCIALVTNMFVGSIRHLKSGTFSFKEFIWGNIIMGFSVIIGYMMLDMLRYTAGNNIAGELFKITIQFSTLLYPTSKVLKNLFILSNGAFPPEFIMQRLYKFEKSGDLEELFKNKDKNKSETE